MVLKDDVIIIKVLVWSGEKVKILSNSGGTMSDFDEHLIFNCEQVNISGSRVKHDSVKSQELEGQVSTHESCGSRWLASDGSKVGLAIYHSIKSGANGVKYNSVFVEVRGRVGEEQVVRVLMWFGEHS
jgi:hypothetical protein